jgi:hypothetical protein
VASTVVLGPVPGLVVSMAWSEPSLDSVALSFPLPAILNGVPQRSVAKHGRQGGVGVGFAISRRFEQRVGVKPLRDQRGDVFTRSEQRVGVKPLRDRKS